MAVPAASGGSAGKGARWRDEWRSAFGRVRAAALQLHTAITGRQPYAPAARRHLEAESSATARLNNFAGLRLAAALLVVYGHQTTDLTGTFGMRLVLFFSISGFLIAGSWRSDPQVPRFLLRRFLRVWPAYAAVIVACAAVSYLFPATDMPELSRLASLFYLSNLWFAGFEWGFFPSAHNPFMNQSLWMMRFEVDIYLAFAAIAFLGRRHLPLIAGAVLVASLRAPETHPTTGGLLECWSLYFAGFFSFGVLLRELPWLRRGVPVMLCMATGVTLLGLGERTAGLLLVIPPLAVWVGERNWPVLRSAARFGDLSFGIFLWAWPVQQVTRLWLDAGLPMPLQFAVVLAQVVTLAWLSWRYIEMPALRFRPGRPGRRGRAEFGDTTLAMALSSPVQAARASASR